MTLPLIWVIVYQIITKCFFLSIQIFCVDNLNFEITQLSPINVNLLNAPSHKEIKEAIKSLALWKASGPNEMSAAIYRVCWENVKKDI